MADEPRIRVLLVDDHPLSRQGVRVLIDVQEDMTTIAEAGNGQPTSNVGPIFNELKAELKTETDRLQQVKNTYLQRFNELARRLNLDEVK